MRKLTSLLILIFSIFSIIGQGCEGGQSEPSDKLPREKKFEQFSFAVITDVHVGRGIINESGIEDYGAPSYEDYDLETGQAIDGNEGGFNYITDRLVATVNWINENYQRENIKFLVILGDISDTAEMSEFFRARKILDNLEIPYVPLIGNHDFWAYVGETSTFDRTPIGDFYFENIFWGKIPNKVNIDRIKQLFGESWQRQEEIEGFAGPLYYFQNYTFSYQGINFIALDYARRDWNLMASAAEPFPETKEWLRKNLEEHKEEIVIVFSHHPYMIRGGFSPTEAGYLTEVVSENDNYVLNFGGHIHNYDNTNAVFGKNSKVPVIVTKGLMGREGDLQEKEDPDFLRIVKVNGLKIDDIDYEGCDNIINITTGLTTCTLILAPVGTPQITPTPSPQIACPPEGEPKFSLGQEVITTDSLKVRENPGLTAREIKTQPRGTSGKILEGPVCADNYVWWEVEYQDGIIGWSAEDWLEVRVITPATPTITTSTPKFETPTPSSIAETKGKIAFVSDRDGNAEIYVTEADGTNQINLTNHPANDGDPVFSPDGQKIAFVSDRDGDYEIYVMNIDGSDIQQLTDNSAKDEEPDWSPDGSYIIFSSNRDENDEIYIMNTDGSSQRNLTNFPRPDQSPRWSPNGERIVFTSEGRGDSIFGPFPLLYTMNPDGAEIFRLPGLYGGFLERTKASDWSPDGRYIAFSEIDEGIGGYVEMHLYEIESQFAHLIGEFLGQDLSGAFSPDGKWLSFASTRNDRNWEIYLFNLETEEIRRLTENTSADWDPAWSW